MDFVWVRALISRSPYVHGCGGPLTMLRPAKEYLGSRMKCVHRSIHRDDF